MKRYYKEYDNLKGETMYYKQIIPKVRHRTMRDEEGRSIEARLNIYETSDKNYNKITLIILYLDDYSYKIYRPTLFLKNNDEDSFKALYEICKINDYEEGKLIRGDK